ncbi:hypothetical protein BLX87_06480 [Bacillus sp. VT-16-64]|nr:hypothetical protein BLX87_06480 [Bacillus sp. VT-16-64]
MSKSSPSAWGGVQLASFRVLRANGLRRYNWASGTTADLAWAEPESVGFCYSVHRPSPPISDKIFRNPTNFIKEAPPKDL